LMIFEPGRSSRTDIFSNTSAVDILPTLLHVTGQKSADWTEGIVLPPFGQEQRADRKLFVIEARENAQYGPINKATITYVKGQYKLMYFVGYPELGVEGERLELYDVHNDPEELIDLASSKPETRAELFNELKQKLMEENKPYL
jgi:arylsulfatase A-like enzyme